MLYNEFIEGTGCRDNAHNFKVYKDLEVMYMNSDLTKTEIYEYGKKLVDNSKSKEEIEFEQKIMAEIEALKIDVEYYRSEIAWAEQEIKTWKEFGDQDMVNFRRNDMRYYKDEKRKANQRIKELRWVLA